MSNKKSHRAIGDMGETIALKYLQKHGYTIADTNYSIVGGEIDIIARNHENIYIFIEVKYRKNIEYGHPLESISLAKKRALKRTVIAYANKKRIDLDDCRVDVIGIIKKSDAGGHRLFHIKGIEI
ncbi:YraN family protein [Candidatus Gracilibacteria bacterium]|nr:MAG: YraN family protein [Candidatus Gracilibacteria bacterium]